MKTITISSKRNWKFKYDIIIMSEAALCLCCILAFIAKANTFTLVSILANIWFLTSNILHLNLTMHKTKIDVVLLISMISVFIAYFIYSLHYFKIL